MFIRDRLGLGSPAILLLLAALPPQVMVALVALALLGALTCLLYTSDAADERSSVDLGGRRIIKKKQCIYVTA
mgnify:CR=1 FL=1